MSQKLHSTQLDSNLIKESDSNESNRIALQGVGFKIDEVELEEDIRVAYNKSVDLWVDLLHKFQEAAELIDADKKMKKTMWGQYWSSHQRFFKYLCIASKVT